MKILMVLDKMFPTDLRVQNEATSLIQAGHEVGLLSVSTYEKSQVITFKGIRVYQVAVSRFQSKKMHGLAGMVPWMDRFIAREVLEIFNEESYDAIHFHDLYMFGASEILREKTDVLMVGDLHENYVDVLRDYAWSTKFPNRLLISYSKWRRKEKEWLANMDKVIVVNEGMKQKNLAKGVREEDMVIVENMMNTRVFDEYESDPDILQRFSSGFNLLFVGGFIGNRGLEHVVRGMDLLRDYEDINLILVGDGAVKPELERITDELNLHDRVHFEGWQDQEKVKSYLQVSQVGMVPFKRTPQTDNSSPNKLFQYMYYGIPILSTDCPSIKELVEKEECGLVYESEQTKQFAENVIRLYEDADLRKQLSANSRKAVEERYNWDVNVRDMLEMYRGLEEKLKS